jgi:hypothetical protein
MPLQSKEDLMRIVTAFATLAIPALVLAGAASTASHANGLDGLTSGPVNAEVKKHGADDKPGDKRGRGNEDECIVDDRC